MLASTQPRTITVLQVMPSTPQHEIITSGYGRARLQLPECLGCIGRSFPMLIPTYVSQSPDRTIFLQSTQVRGGLRNRSARRSVVGRIKRGLATGASCPGCIRLFGFLDLGPDRYAKTYLCCSEGKDGGAGPPENKEKILR